ncbi:MAG: hypothetical protein ACFFKA_05065, partial [Candidatus Thorarchaeota archaeon]
KALRPQELEALSTKDREIEDTTKQAMDLIDEAESAVRSYELSLKKDILGYKSPYEQVILNYENARKLFQKIGWNKEALKLKNTINFYKDKKIKDDNLREFEKQKLEESKQKVILAPKKEVFVKEERIIDFEKVKSTESKESEAILNDIDHAERLAQEYEIKKKEGILNIESPFEEIIKIYIKAKYDFKRIGWTNQAYQLENTIIYYKDKANADERLRILEAEKIAKEEEQRKKQKIEAQLAKKAEQELLRLKAHELEIQKKTAMEYKSKESEEILNNIEHAEKLAQEYEIKKKDGILDIESPFQEIIKIYEKAKLEFKRIGWTDQAYQLENTIHYYKDKVKVDENLRTLEAEKIVKEEQLRKKQKIEAKLAKDAEEELLRLKAHELEIKRKSAMEYESKKEQAFNFMDLAKKELKQNNFEKAVSYYKESEKIFAEIKWPEGIRMINESINAIKLKKEKIEREAQLIEAKKLEKLKLEAQIQEQINKAKDKQKLKQEQRRKELLAIQEEKEKEREISENAYRFIEEGTKLKDEKKFEEAYDKYMMGRDLFKKIEWEHEVSRINNDLLIILKKEMKQTQKLKAIQQKKIEEKKELEELLKEADEKQKELEIIRKEEKRKQREKIIQKERDIANDIIKTLRYNEGVLALKKVIKKIENTDLDNLSRDMKKQIEELEKTSQVPIITNVELDREENIDKFKLAFQALDNAQISLSNNVFMRAITELNEALFNLNETKIGQNFIPIIEEKINFYKKELDIKETPEKKIEAPKVESDDIRAKIAARRAERKKKIKKLLGDDDYDDN